MMRAQPIAAPASSDRRSIATAPPAAAVLNYLVTRDSVSDVVAWEITRTVRLSARPGRHG
jgi:hypothetical protein